MDEHEVHRRAESARVARLSTLEPQGRLHIVPFCFVLREETLYSAIDEKPKATRRLQRLRNIEAHPDVAVLIDHYEEDWDNVWWVRLRGRARIIEAGDPEHEKAIALLSEKYPQYREVPPGGPTIAIDLTDWRWWSAS